VIILDINLPGMNGIEALKKLRGFDETKSIPTLAMSAAATQADIKQGMNAGFSQYLTKPVIIIDVVDAIRNALGSGE
jgi:two-component system cell cycle response regulator DivK